jgi:RNA polymerase sigma-70 factor (ECF subfamily)
MKRFSNVADSGRQGRAKSTSFPGILGDNTVDELMDRILGTDDYSAFELLFHKMYSPLCHYCGRIVLVPEVAEELVSDVFYSIWKNRRRIHVLSPKSYLYTAVRNRGFDYLRRVNRISWCDLQFAAHLPSENYTLQDALEHAELKTQISQGIGMLPRQCKIIFELSRDEGMKYREIAEELCISVKTVEAQMGRALKRLRRIRESAIDQI